MLDQCFQSNIIYINIKLNEVFADTEVIYKIKINQNLHHLDFNLKYSDDNIVFSKFIIKMNNETILSKIVSNNQKLEIDEDFSNELSNYSFITNNIDVDDNQNQNKDFFSEYSINLKKMKKGEYILIKIYYIQFISTFDSSYYFKLINNLPSFRFENEDSDLIFDKIKCEINLETKSRITRLLFQKRDKYFKTERKYNMNFTKCLIKLECRYNCFFGKIMRIIFKTEDMKNCNIFTQYNEEFNETSYFIHYIHNPFEKDNNNLYPDENNNLLYSEYIKENLETQSCFIFLISMNNINKNKNISYFIKTIVLIFLNFLPKNSVFNIIGFNKDINEKHKLLEYNFQNIENVKKNIEKNNILNLLLIDELENIFEFTPTYKNIKQPKNLIILTDGKINKENECIRIINENYKKFNLDFITFEENIISIQNLGKHYHHFNHVIKTENNIFEVLKKIIKKGLRQYSLKNKFSFLNENIENLIINQPENKFYYHEDSIPFSFIKKGKLHENISLNLESDSKKFLLEINNENINILNEGNQLSRLIIDKYLNNYKLKISKEEKNELSEKYQIISKTTFLFGQFSGTSSATSLGSKNLEKLKGEQFLEENEFFQDFEILESPIEPKRNNNSRFSKSFYISVDKMSQENTNNKKGFEGKVNLIKLIIEQNIIEGFWEENTEEAKIILHIYERVYNHLKKKLNKNNNKLSITFVILYYLEKEKSEILNDIEYSLIKGKKYLVNNKISYDHTKTEFEKMLNKQ